MTGGFDNQQLIEADKKLSEFIEKKSREEDFRQGYSVVDIIVGTIFLLSFGTFELAVAFPVLSFGFKVYKNYATKAFLMRISKPALTSNVLQLILLGPTELEKIYTYTPIPWRWFFLMGRPKKFSNWVFLVAQHLDWYQREPKQFLPIRWVIQTILAIIVVTEYSSLIVWKVPLLAGSKVMDILLLMYPFIILVDLGNAMKLAGARVLHAELQTFLPETPED